MFECTWTGVVGFLIMYHKSLESSYLCTSMILKGPADTPTYCCTKNFRYQKDMHCNLSVWDSNPAFARPIHYVPMTGACTNQYTNRDQSTFTLLGVRQITLSSIERNSKRHRLCPQLFEVVANEICSPRFYGFV